MARGRLGDLTKMPMPENNKTKINSELSIQAVVLRSIGSVRTDTVHH